MKSMKFTKKAGLGFFLVLVHLTTFTNAQSRVVRVKNGQDATKIISAKDRFEYPEFQYGKLTFINGNHAVSKINYCLLLGEIMFINTNGDTLALADNNQIRYADIGNTRFYPIPENGFVEIIEDCGVMLLAKKVQYQKDGIERKVAYQGTSQVASSYNASTFTDINGRTTILPPDNTILLKPAVSYLFMDTNHRFNKATRSNFLRIFSKNKSAVIRYLDEHNVDYSNEEDLKKAVIYCSEL